MVQHAVLLMAVGLESLHDLVDSDFRDFDLFTHSLESHI